MPIIARTTTGTGARTPVKRWPRRTTRIRLAPRRSAPVRGTHVRSMPSVGGLGAGRGAGR
ncbi:MAG: hypothetical protein D6705_04765 [Deltaproteobacteria bacterium]|nr:MAG: hypothetical protein D6705_04765 [Deltaproteobacteria bacterium]